MIQVKFKIKNYINCAIEIRPNEIQQFLQPTASGFSQDVIFIQTNKLALNSIKNCNISKI